MNLNLLKKLVKLANHNPNEHEANSAARRVCRMIEAEDFKFTELPPPSPSSPVYDEATNLTSDMFEKMIRDIMERESRSRGFTRPSPDPIRYNPFTKAYSPWEPPKPEAKPERILNCRTCKKEVKTLFVGQPELFECNPCQWTAFMKI
jgi:hypothetical protein